MEDSYVECIKLKINEAEELISKCKDLNIKDGQKKLKKKVEAELKFLRKLSEHPDKIKKEHLRCSNISHLSAILHCAVSSSDVCEVLKPFSYSIRNVLCQNELKRIVVDVVADCGHCWIKVVARNPQAMAQSSLGSCEFGKRNILEQLQDMIECAKQNPYMYHSVSIKVWFTSGITNTLKQMIEKLGIKVLADNIQDDPILYLEDEDNEVIDCNINTNSETGILSFQQYCHSVKNDNQFVTEENCSRVNDEEPLNSLEKLSIGSSLTDTHTQDSICSTLPLGAVLNLDVSTMIAYVSALTNGHCDVRFSENILTEQAERERSFPVKMDLDKIFVGRRLICCETAHRDFTTIVSTIGGENEKLRASDLLSKLVIVPDCPSKKALSLKKSSKVKERPMIIFGSGDNLKAVTVSSNHGFVRAAEGQGIRFVVYLHESRALTEVKQTISAQKSEE